MQQKGEEKKEPVEASWPKSAQINFPHRQAPAEAVDKNLEKSYYILVYICTYNCPLGKQNTAPKKAGRKSWSEVEKVAGIHTTGVLAVPRAQVPPLVQSFPLQ